MGKRIWDTIWSISFLFLASPAALIVFIEFIVPLLVIMDQLTAKNHLEQFPNLFRRKYVVSYVMFVLCFGRFGSVLVGFQIAGWSWEVLCKEI